MKLIDTARLVLRPMQPADIPAYAAFRGDPEVGRYLPALTEDAREVAARNIASFAAHWKTRGFGVWGVYQRGGGALVGQCGLNWVEQFGEVEVLYALARHAWGQGLATEAARAAVDFGFGPAGLKRIIGLVLPANNASRRVIEKLGMAYRHDVTFHAMRVRYYQRDREKR